MAPIWTPANLELGLSNKNELLKTPNKYITESERTISDFIKEPELVNFYMNNIDVLLEQYTQGKPENKPDVIKQLEDMNRTREKLVLEYQI